MGHATSASGKDHLSSDEVQVFVLRCYHNDREIEASHLPEVEHVNLGKTTVHSTLQDALEFIALALNGEPYISSQQPH